MWSVIVAIAACTPAQAGEDAEFFESRVRPLLVERCYRCHSSAAKKLKGGLSVETRDALLKGGESGKPAVVPGNVAKSLLIAAVRRESPELEMPPDRPLSAGEVAVLEAWIESGAPDPRVATATIPAGEDLAAAARRWWAFQPPQSSPIPTTSDPTWPASGADCFVLARLDERGLAPSPQAPRRAMIRRLTYDLTGLPPSPDEVEAFSVDDAPDSWERVVDRLLASPRFGERWARRWLDVARYSDTKGYVYSDREESRFVHSHVYRDWVVNAFNRDLGYDDFLRLQIAADDIAGDAGRDRSDPANRSDLAAMGFLTLGRRFLGVVHDIIDDRIDVVFRGTQALTVGCARCHDHKFDPVPSRDYYSLYGVFASSTESTVELVRPEERPPESHQWAQGLEERQEKYRATARAKRLEYSDRLRAKSAEYLALVLEVETLPSEEFYEIRGPDDLIPTIVRRWEAYIHSRRKPDDAVFAPWHALAQLAAKDFPDKAGAAIAELRQGLASGRRVNRRVLDALAESPLPSMRAAAERFGGLLASVHKSWKEIEARNTSGAGAGAPPARLDDPDLEELRQVLYSPTSPVEIPEVGVADLEWFFDEGVRVQLSKLQAETERWINGSTDATPHAVVLVDRQQLVEPRVFVRGNPAQKGEATPRQFVACLSSGERAPFTRGSGRRELADAIASPGNPLTARVFVNRVWMAHFAAGIVTTPSDFGTRSAPPSHPELLDWLALRFVADGWSLKSLTRRIVLTSVYQQSSAERADGMAADPENIGMWRVTPQRLDFESLRDSLLAAGGELDLRLGGRAEPLFDAAGGRRRSLYGFVDRQFLPGLLRTFDFANPDAHAPERHTTTVPQQALYLMNSAFSVERSRALARRSARECGAGPGAVPEVDAFVRAVYASTLQRPPSSLEAAAGREYLAASTPNDAPCRAERPPDPWLYGFGRFDAASGRVADFTPLPHFTGMAWQGGEKWPDAALGWVQLTATGGHTGNDLAHAAVRRWVAPERVSVSVDGEVRHEHAEGEGLVARIVSSRDGPLAAWTLHNQRASARISPLVLERGDTLDFVVDFRAQLGYDDFLWAPIVRVENRIWNAAQDFRGPEEVEPLDAWGRYAQVLLLSSEFAYRDGRE